MKRIRVRAGRILRGTKPAELPIDQAMRVVVINARRRAMGVTIPQSLLLRADEVVQ